MANRLECIDAGTDYCPCYLAELNECIVCSQLQGKNFCDCNWRGVCIFQEFVWAGYKAKATRSTIFSKVLKREEINEEVIILTLKVPNKMARDLNEPGSFVFLRGISSPPFFDTPMSVMYADELEGIIKIAIQVSGPKTKLIQKAEEGEEVYLRGPYWNGLLGYRYIKGTHNSKALVVLRGIAQAPGVIVISKLINNKNKVIAIVDKGKVGVNFINDYLKEFNITIIEAELLSEEGQRILKELIKDKEITVVYSGGSDEQHVNILNYLDLYNQEAYLAVSNNNTICCGEGICGSCEVQIGDQKVRTCKVQVDIRKALERKMLHG
ncbi:sulfide/dihydroorotate dehydrogenase-like FAD/NAD-binding protein [Thermoanaerobacter sp. X514]|uniref:sulfide/dihydroorotate dehydrogenase-like FAD/NAD-binding protein n=1 Tax=Thermoanaerobacter sp. (strain X514) TaxID=399726 RepID=UPI0000E1DBD1|nr:sulfide/dihydroorotate dehydrogenase-like FAD/NAD-binding protein [Thermoanaerobacter sp. X514]ABY92863.1 Oxidoreductase FAD-binding domain protein [Thermoanaerobacter sp. X514]MBZ4655651.1 Oxidoreductase FAD-binding domain protein [Thermoanaerobacter sp.]